MCNDSQLPYLHIHQDDIRAWVRRAELLHQILQCLLAVPHRIDRKVKLFDGLKCDLLVDMAGYLSDVDFHDHVLE
jgi:hypothetical protein